MALYNNPESVWHGRANGERIENLLQQFPDYDLVANRVRELFDKQQTGDSVANVYLIFQCYLEAIKEIGTLVVIAHDSPKRSYWNWVSKLDGEATRRLVCGNCKQHAIICCGAGSNNYCFWCCPSKARHDEEWNEKSQNPPETSGQ